MTYSQFPGELLALGDGGWFSNHPPLVLLIVLILGLMLGRVSIAGIALGSSGVIFIALAAGHFGYALPKGIGPVGLVLFIYSIGLSAGPSFFRAFRRHGAAMSLLAVTVVALGAIAAAGSCALLRVPVDLAAGVFTGALTSTPGLAAGLEALPPGSQAGVGYGVSYPFGLVGVVLFVHLVPRLLRVNITELRVDPQEYEDRRIVRVLVKVLNPAVIGKKLSELRYIQDSNCQVSRMLVGKRLVPIPADLVLEEGQHLLLIARAFRLPPIIYLLGERDEISDLFMDTEDQSQHIVVSSPRIVGKSLIELNLRSRFGVTVTRFIRHDIEFVPRLTDRIEYGDMLNVVGEPEALERFAEFAGHRVRTFDETDLISLGVGIALGVVIGVIEFGIGGRTVSLGLAGGPLLVALVLGHFGHIGPVKGHMPRAARMLLTEIGLMLLLADAGMAAGTHVGQVMQAHGLALCISAIVTMIAPMILGALFAHYVLHLPLLSILGGICGGMTSSPGIGAVTSKTDSEAPVVAYAAAYPVALIMMTVFVRIIVAVMG